MHKEKEKVPAFELPRGEIGLPSISRHSSSDLLSRIEGGSRLMSAPHPPSPSGPEDQYAEYPSDSDVTMHTAELTTPNTVALHNLMEKARLRALARAETGQGQQEKDTRAAKPAEFDSGSTGPPKTLAERLGLIKESGTEGEMDIDPPVASEPSAKGETLIDKATGLPERLEERLEERPESNQQALQTAKSSLLSAGIVHSTPTSSSRIYVSPQHRSFSTSPVRTRQEPTDVGVPVVDEGDAQAVPSALSPEKEDRINPIVTASEPPSITTTKQIEDTLDADENEVDASLFVDRGSSVDRDIPPHLNPPVVTLDSSAERMRVLRERLLRRKQEKKAQVPEAGQATSSLRRRLDDDEGPISLPIGVSIDEFGKKGGRKASESSQGKRSASSNGKDNSASSSKRSTTPSRRGTARADSRESGRGDRGNPGPRRPPVHTNFPDVYNDLRRFQPIGESIYVPHRLKHPFRLYPNGTRFDIREASRYELETHTIPDGRYFEVASMPACDYTSRMPEFQESPRDQRKLLTLDLNGCLVVRSKHAPSGGTPRRV